MVGYEIQGHCAVITIERPEARNAVSPEVARGIEDTIDRAEGDDAVRVAVLTGAGPVFCAGADLKAIGAGRAAELSTARGGFAGVARRARTKPLIAAVDGPALAGGFEIVLACDLVVASTSATFGLPEVKRGLIAGAGGLFRLGRKLPMNVAMATILTGEAVSVHDAHRFGLVNEICEPGHALAAALELAERIGANAPLAVRQSRAVALAGTHADDAVAWQHSEDGMAVVLDSDDVREGVQAFVEKRAPSWTGR